MPDVNGDEDADASSVPPRRRGRVSTPTAAVIRSGREALSAEMALTLFRQMVRTRALEERSIKMSKSGEAFFWIGGPGEEAFNVSSGCKSCGVKAPRSTTCTCTTETPASCSLWACR